MKNNDLKLGVKWDLEDTTTSIHRPLVSLCSLSLHRAITDTSVGSRVCLLLRRLTRRSEKRTAPTTRTQTAVLRCQDIDLEAAISLAHRGSSDTAM